jgi:hypothetical protein
MRYVTIWSNYPSEIKKCLSKKKKTKIEVYREIGTGSFGGISGGISKVRAKE